MPDESVHLILTSIPFSTQYEYTPSFHDFGHSDDNDHFFRQMDFLTPELLRILKPGRNFMCHVKDRIVPGGMTGLGFQTVYPFHAACIAHYTKHGFAYLGMKTIVTDVVRENNQTYRLGWTEQCKDGSRMGVGMPEYLLLFRKPPSDQSDGYADEPVIKEKPFCVCRNHVWNTDMNGREVGPCNICEAPLGSGPSVIPFNPDLPIKPGTGYSRSRWQLDAHGFMRSSGDRYLSAHDIRMLKHADIYKLYRAESIENVYNFEQHVSTAEMIEGDMRLPVTFMLLPPQSWHPDVWTDITRMLTLNGAQSAAGREMHLCLAEGSLVLTYNGYRPIEDVQIGDMVLTHKGRWRPIVDKVCNGPKEVVKLRGQGVARLIVTPEHPIWTRYVGENPWSKNHSRKKAQTVEPEWVEAAETKGHYVNLKLPPIQDSPYSCQEWWIVGRWLGDGHIGSNDEILISCAHDETEELLARLGPHAGAAHQGPCASQIRLKDRGRRLRDLLLRFGRGACGKRIPGEALELEQEKAESLLQGYLSADGHYVTDRGRFSASSVSRPLALGIAMVAQRARGIIAAVYGTSRIGGPDVIQGRSVQTHAEWMIDIPPRNRSGILLEDGAWKRIRHVEPQGEAEVWDITVEEDHSFTAEGCIVQNCPMQFDLADRIIRQFSQEGETVFDPFMGIGTVPARAIKQKRKAIGIELSHGYFLDAVMYCKAEESKINMPGLFDLLEPEEEIPTA